MMTMSKVPTKSTKNKANLAGGTILIFTGIVEMASSGGPCPFCIGAIGGGISMIANEFRSAEKR